MDSEADLLFSTSNKSIKIWDVTTHEQIFSSGNDGHKGIIKCVKVMPTNSNGQFVGDKIFATGGDKFDKSVILWDMVTFKPLH